MPFVEEEKVIKTKIIGVASKIDDNDTMSTRQVVLEEMFDHPELVSMLYLRKRRVYVSFDDGREFYLGDIKLKYEELIMNNVTQIVSWQLTGGHEIPFTPLVIAGQTVKRKDSMRAKFGVNIHVKLL